MMRTIRNLSRTLWRDVRGVSAIEFALILPIGLVMLYGASESGYLLLLDRKVTAATQSAGDLVAQEEAVTDADLTDIFNAVNTILRPYPTADLVFSVASVSINDDGDQILDWIFPVSATSPIASGNIPNGLLSTTSQSVIVADMSYPYTPNLSIDLFSGFTIADRAYLRPRNGGKVTKN
jgi:Flp pilus assembly protein TadG